MCIDMYTTVNKVTCFGTKGVYYSGVVYILILRRFNNFLINYLNNKVK